MRLRQHLDHRQHASSLGQSQCNLRTDVCSKCHPFFTGEQRIVDTAGRVERFMARMQRAGERPAAPAPKPVAPAPKPKRPAKPAQRPATLETLLGDAPAE